MGVGSPILYLENRILKDIYSKKERHKRGNFFMSAEKIETSEAVYRDIYGKTKKNQRPEAERYPSAQSGKQERAPTMRSRGR